MGMLGGKILISNSSDTILLRVVLKLTGSLLFIEPRRHADGLVPWKGSSSRVLPSFFLIISDPADKVIFWVVLPDGVLWIEFLQQVNSRHLLILASLRIGRPKV